MKRTFCIYPVLLLILLLEGSFSVPAASQVTLEISTTTSLAQGIINAKFRLTNKGSEAAHEVSVHGAFFEKQHSVFIADRLNPGQSAEAGVAFDLPENLHGTYPYYITVLYQHADGAAVAAASLARINSGIRSNPRQSGLQVSADLVASQGEIRIHLETRDAAVEFVTVTAHGPEDLTLEPSEQRVNLHEGKGLASFKATNISGSRGSTYGIYFAVEYTIDGIDYLTTADTSLPVEKITRAHPSQPGTLHTLIYALVLLLVLLLVVGMVAGSKTRQQLFRTKSIPGLLDVLVLLAVEIFIFSKVDLPSLFTLTTTTGGDTASHYYTLDYLRHTLLPAGKITGWTMGNYAGFPLLQFYFPLPFLIMSLFDLVMPLQVAFKLVTLLGSALLPVAAYVMLRLLRCPFPGPGIGALLMLPFLFNPANSMWGGNFLSTLAGEFSYSLSMAISLILVGSLYRGALENKWIIRNGLLVFLVGFSHGYTLLFAEAMSLFLLITPYGFSKRAIYLFKVYALGFCLLAFWLVPLLVFTKFTTSYHLVWTISSFREVIPEILQPAVYAGFGGSFVLLGVGIRQYRTAGPVLLTQLAFLWFGLAAALVFFVAAPRLGVVDIRYVPYGQLMVCLMAALFMGWTGHYVLNRWGLNRLLLIIVAAGVMQWTGDRIGPVGGWTKWNYEGFEAKKAWPVFKQINKELQGTFQEPRVVYEHSQDHNMFGSSRAFESLPLFAVRATLEGLYMQASITAPFVFYIQTLVSRESSQPFPQYSYTTMNFERARRYLALFNVRDLVLKSREAKAAVRQVKGYEKINAVGQYELWQLTSNTGQYVEVLQFEPVAYQGSEQWKQVAYQWFLRDDLADVHLVFNDRHPKKGAGPLNLTADSLAAMPRRKVDTSGCSLRETIRDDEIFLETTCPGKPHLVKVSYHPNWQVEGADKVYLVSPSFMLVYPGQEKVRLFYGPGPWDRLGQLLTLFGVAVLLLNISIPGTGGRTGWSVMTSRLNLPAPLKWFCLPDPGPAARKTIMLGILIATVTLVATGSYLTYVNEPHRAYNRSIRAKDLGQYRKARTGFRKFMQTYPLSHLAQESSYYLAITYYLEKNDRVALRSFEEFLKRYPRGNRVAEVHYHIGLILLRSDRRQEGIQRMLLLKDQHPQSPWADYAEERLQGQGYSPQGEPTDINQANLNRYMGRAIAYFNQDRLDEAKPILRQISERFPGFSGAPQALAALALCYYKEGDCLATVKYYQKLLKRYPGHNLAAEAYFHLGLCFEKLGDPDRAEEAFRKTLAVDPGGAFGQQATNKIAP